MNFIVADVHVKGGSDGVHVKLTNEGRPSGEAYIEMETEEDMQKGMVMNNKNMGSRYIEGKHWFHAKARILYPIY